MADTEAMTTVEARLMAATLSALQGDMSEMRTSMAGMRSALEALVRMDEQQSNMRAAIGRAFDEVKAEREKREALEGRVRIMEVDAPSYKELRRWVIGGVLTGILMMAGALFKVVVSDPLDRGYVRPPLTAPIAHP